MTISSPWPSQAPYAKQHLSECLRQVAEQQPDKTALISADERFFSFGEIWDASRRIARMLQEDAGLKKGEAVAIYAGNSPEYVVAVHGILLAGGVVTTVNPQYKEQELVYHLCDSGAVALFGMRALLPMVSMVKSELEECAALRRTYAIHDIWDMAAAAGGYAEPVAIDPEKDLAALPYSSGTTGLPKGVMLTHANLCANVRQNLATGLAQPGAVSIDFLPFDHIFGLIPVMNVGLANASAQVIVPQFDARLVLYLIHKYSVTDLFVVPPALRSLIDLVEQGRKYDTSSLRFIISGAAPLLPRTAEAAQRLFGCPVIQGYGLTEASPVTNINPLDRPKLSSVGMPVSDTLEKVVSTETGEELPAGEMGELLVKGPQVMKGYWKQPEATAEAMTDDGWLRTGDICRFDEEGYVYVLDRKKDTINYKGYSVAPAELEAVIRQHPSVMDAAVIPKSDAIAGEIAKAFVVARPGQRPTTRDIIQFVEDRVAPHKRIREVEFVWELPKSEDGELLRRKLVERERARAQEAE
jgi:acyl-CoA synthetase (AMP-forming)/AMP-acid ligase II